MLGSKWDGLRLLMLVWIAVSPIAAQEIDNGKSYGYRLSIAVVSGVPGQYEYEERGTPEVAPWRLRALPTGPVWNRQRCGDERDEIIDEYSTYGLPSSPSCEDLSASGGSTHFSFDEVNRRSDHHDHHHPWAWIEQELLDGLERTRKEYDNKPMVITSGYRCPVHNRLLREFGYKPSDSSQHQFGRAVDVSAPTPREMADLMLAADEAGATKVLAYSKSVHMAW